jgi:hypothetical protein
MLTVEVFAAVSAVYLYPSGPRACTGGLCLSAVIRMGTVVMLRRMTDVQQIMDESDLDA